MDYYRRSQLPVLNYCEEREAVSKEEIREALCRKPCNRLIKEILKDCSIQVVELPRIQTGGKAISAYAARPAAEEGDIRTPLANVPATSLRFFGFGEDTE